MNKKSVAQTVEIAVFTIQAGAALHPPLSGRFRQTPGALGGMVKLRGGKDYNFANAFPVGQSAKQVPAGTASVFDHRIWRWDGLF